MSGKSFEDLVDLGANEFFDVAAGGGVVGSVGKGGDDGVLDIADLASGLESSKSRFLKKN